jgi:hypothetical protein
MKGKTSNAKWWVFVIIFALFIGLQCFLVWRWIERRGQQSREVVAPEPPRDPSQVAFQRHSYAIFKERSGWQDSFRLCQEKGGYLVCITSEEEQAFVVSFLRESPYSRNAVCWLGATSDQARVWRWVNGEEVQMTDYLKAEDPREHYLNFRLTTGRWEDYPEQGETDGEQWCLCEWDR